MDEVHSQSFHLSESPQVWSIRQNLRKESDEFAKKEGMSARIDKHLTNSVECGDGAGMAHQLIWNAEKGIHPIRKGTTEKKSTQHRTG
jgi:hypothetical protein